MAKNLLSPTQLPLHLFRPKSFSLHRVLHFSNRFVSRSRILLPGCSSICIKSNMFAKHFSTTKTPYPLQYEMIISRPTQSSLARPRIRRQSIEPPHAASGGSSESDSSPDSEELHFDDWVDRKLSIGDRQSDNAMDKSKRKYYSKRMKRMYGLEADDKERKKSEENSLVELESDVVELRTLHKKEEELYFYDTFAYPWEKDKHYKMVYQLEKKYFPDQCLDKAFLEPGETNLKNSKKMEKAVNNVKKEVVGNVREEGKEEDKGLVFFDDKESSKDVKKEISEKKVKDFFKCLKKIPNKDDQISNVEPYLLTRSSELPGKWDSPGGTVVLVNKPKGWTSFTVCGKLRRLVKVKKVGHCGTLDPMATGLLIVCVGRATKVVERYQGMIKGYSGVFRLGEATSTWDADSPVIQREPWEHIKDSEIKKAAKSFCGEIWQVPPMFSAIKIGGEKMYEKARRGESVELSPKRISIFKFEIERSLEDRQNLIYRVVCSKGTYIRSLCADLGKALGSCAHLTAIRRDSIGEYAADDAWDFKELEEAITKNYM